MQSTRTRYPGAQSFGDDPLSRTVFFGRDKEAAALTDLIVTHRLVIVYAKSGLGKTSLLNAGVSEPLREAAFLPISLRVNRVGQDLIPALLADVQAVAERCGVEHVPGDGRSLWHFFKTAEFWRGDVLLTPVLILDQFEEIFTLQAEPARARLLLELGHLIRGVAPAVQGPADAAPCTPAPPAVRVVLSLREDYLGHLEEAADYLPAIMDHRFRLLPLSLAAASAAMQGPAQVEDSMLATRPFVFQAGVTQRVLEHLLQQHRAGHLGGPSPAGRHVEPFHLQLICQRVENIVARLQASGRAGTVEIGWSDLGGAEGLQRTLRNFYFDIIRSLPSRRTRSRVRALCEEHLISTAGRRLSLDENEITRMLKVDRATLQGLVNRRLLRADQRVDSWYYELSHDSLIAPILSSRRMQAIVLGLSGLLTSLMILLMSFTLGLLLPSFAAYSLLSGDAEATENWFVMVVGAVFSVVLGLFIGAAGRGGLRRSVDTLNRFVPPVR